MPDKRGMITVEMSMVMLTVLWVTFLIICLSFYSWDMHRLDAAARYTLETDHTDKIDGLNEDELKGYYMDFFDNCISAGFFCTHDVKSYCSIEGDGISLGYTGIWKCPFQGWIFMNKGFEINGSVSVKNVKQAEFLWFIHGVIKGLGD